MRDEQEMMREPTWLTLVPTGNLPPPPCVHAAVTETGRPPANRWPAVGAGMAWEQHLPAAERAQWFAMGSRLIAVLARCDRGADLPSGSPEAALEYGRAYGRLMARAGRSLADAVVGFLSFRDALLGTAQGRLEAASRPGWETLARYGRTKELMNRVLRAMIDGFNEVR